MSLLAGVGSSQNPISRDAVTEAYTQSIATFGGALPTFILLLASPTAYKPEELLITLKELNTQATIIGCSTSGEITSTSGSQDSSLALLSLYSDTMTFTPGLGEHISTNSRTAGQNLAKKYSGKK